MQDTIVSIIAIIVLISMMAFAAVAFFSTEKSEEQTPAVYMIISNETGVCYYATSAGAIVPVYNPDGTLYSVSQNN